jgi:hypothetical protein
MHQAHTLSMRGSVTLCVVIRENGKGGSPVALARTEAANFNGIGARKGLPDPLLQRQAKLYGLELKPTADGLSGDSALSCRRASTRPSGARQSNNSNP